VEVAVLCVCAFVCSAAATLPRFFPASQHSRTEWCTQAALTELLRPALVKVKLIPVRSSVFWPCAALSVWPAFLLRKRAFQWNNINPLRPGHFCPVHYSFLEAFLGVGAFSCTLVLWVPVLPGPSCSSFLSR
jgi:hypothetical protein